MKEEIEAVASWLSILIAASYTFTIGYLDALKIPANPSPTEAFSFYLRAILTSDHGGHGVLLIFGPLVLFIVFIKIFRLIQSTECFKAGLKRSVLDFIALALGLAAITGWCHWSFNEGHGSLNKPSAGTFFPEAYRNIKATDMDGKEKMEKKSFRLAWISEKKYFWLDCNKSQPQLVGVENELEFFVRRLGPGSIDTICNIGG